MTRDESIGLLKEVQLWLRDAMIQALTMPENSITQIREKRLLCLELRGRWNQFHREYQKLTWR